MSYTPTIMAAVLAFGVTALTGFWLIPLLRRLKYGQTILDIGPKWHKSKQGIPTMGGIMFIAGIVVAVSAGYFMMAASGSELTLARVSSEGMPILLGLIMALCYGMIGFVDDYIKVVKKRNLGLSVAQKMVMQFFVAILYLAGLWMSGYQSTVVDVPFLGQFNLGVFFYPLAATGIVYLVNVVNITDGVDGLCASVTLVTAVSCMVIATYLTMQGMGMLAAALAGGCLGFLLWNFHPARIFMGDTGSLFLGGVVVALGFGLNIPVFLLLLGVLYVVEGLSVLIQVGYFKLTGGKRLFKMSPIHHHFEMSGWSETKVVAVFSAVQLVGCALAVYGVMRR